MNSRLFRQFLLAPALICVGTALAGADDLRRAADPNAYMVAYARHNPERDYQRAYFEAILKEVNDTKLVEKIVNIVASRISPDQREQAEAVIATLKEAVAPVDCNELMNIQEFMYMQSFNLPVQRQTFCLRTTSETTEDLMQAVRNLFALAEKYSEGKVTAVESREGDGTILALQLPEEAPFQPACAVIDDVFIVSSMREAAVETVQRLAGSGAETKFDDARIKHALSKLPEMEDAVVVFDGATYFEQLRALPELIREKAADDPGAQRALQAVEGVLEQIAVIDFDVTVEYTDGFQNRAEAYSRFIPGTEERVLQKVLKSGQPFEDWSAWVPADAKSFSMSTGASLHPIYEWLVTFIPQVVPEAQAKIDELEAIQAQIGVHLDRDILQAFSGESVSLTLPPAVPSPLATQDSVQFMRCSKPERILELLEMAIDKLKELPPMQAQNLAMVPSTELEGFHEVSAVTLAMFGVKPLIGFRDGWMIIGTNPAAIQKVFSTQEKQSDSFAASAEFAKFNLPVEGPVTSISYANTAQQTREAAQAMSQIGMILPGVLAMAGAEQDADEVKLVGEIIGLLPSIGRIIAKCDFLESKMVVSQAADEPGAFHRRTVILVREPDPEPEVENEDAQEAAEPAEVAIP